MALDSLDRRCIAYAKAAQRRTAALTAAHHRIDHSITQILGIASRRNG